MKTISSCKNLDEFRAAIHDVTGPVLGKGGGRKFIVQGKEVSMNTLVHKYLTLLKKAPVSKEGHDSAVAIVDKLDALNHMALPKLNAKQEKRLAFRQKWGNFFAKIKYGRAFSHENLPSDALRIYAKKLLAEIPSFDKLLSDIKRKKIAPDDVGPAITKIFDKFPDLELLNGFEHKSKTVEITTPLAKPFFKKFINSQKAIDKALEPYKIKINWPK